MFASGEGMVWNVGQRVQAFTPTGSGLHTSSVVPDFKRGICAERVSLLYDNGGLRALYRRGSGALLAVLCSTSGGRVALFGNGSAFVLDIVSRLYDVRT